MSSVVYLLSPARLKTASELQENADDKVIKRAIKAAQDIHLEQILGTKLLDKISSLLPGHIHNPQNEDYKKLLDEYIEDVLIYHSLEELLDLLSVKFMQKGAMKREAEDAIPLSQSELEAMKRRYRSKAQHYEDRLIRYLVANDTKFPEYLDPGDTVDLVKPRKKGSSSGFVF